MNNFWDRLGISASILCVIHCLFTPVLVAVMPFVGATLGGKWFHPIIVALVIPVALWALWNGYSVHRHAKTLWLGAAGLVCIGIAMLYGQDHNIVEVTFMVAAG